MAKKRSFVEWMKLVDVKIAEKLFGMNSRDIPDCPYHDWYDDGVSPATAAARAIRAMSE